MAWRSPSERKYMIVNQTAVKRFQMVLYLAPNKSEKKSDYHRKQSVYYKRNRIYLFTNKFSSYNTGNQRHVRAFWNSLLLKVTYCLIYMLRKQ